MLQRVEAVDFKWTGVAGRRASTANQFSARWTGQVEATATGNFRFQTRSDDGVRLWINGILVIDNWTSHLVAEST